MTGTLVGVGVGPGHPELMTLQAIRTLREADRVVAPSLAVDAVGRAESIVRQAVPGLSIERLVFDMSPAQGPRTASHTAAAEALLPGLDQAQRIAFVTLGDPNIYSTFSALAAAVVALRPTVVIETVAGIMAFQDLAARSGTVLLDGTDSLLLSTALDGAGHLDEALAQPELAIVVYKGGRHLPAIMDKLAQAGRRGVVGELLGLPGERFGPLEEAPRLPASYLATVIVPPVARPGA